MQAAGSGGKDGMRQGPAMTSRSCDRNLITGPARKGPAMTSRLCDCDVITGPALPTLGPEAAECTAHRRHDYKGSLRRSDPCAIGLDTNLEPATNSKGLTKNQVEGIATQAVNILWNVCESNSKALTIFNKENCVEIVIRCLSKFPSNLELSVSAAYCLQTVTEDNPELLASLHASALQMLENVLMTPATSMEMRLLQTLVAGTVWNIKDRIPCCSQADSMNAMLRILAEVLSQDAGQFIIQMKDAESIRLKAAATESDLEEATSSLEEASPNEDEGMGDGTAREQNRDNFSDLVPVSHEELRQASFLLVAQKSALEMIVNMCCSDEPSDDEWEELSSSDESELGLEKSIADGGELMSPLCLSAEVHSALLNHAIPKKVLEKTRFPDDAALQLCRRHSAWKPLITKMSTVQHRALTCLHNILSMVDTECLGGASALQELAQHLSQLVFTQTEQDNMLVVGTRTDRRLYPLQNGAQPLRHSFSRWGLYTFSTCHKENECSVFQRKRKKKQTLHTYIPVSVLRRSASLHCQRRPESTAVTSPLCSALRPALVQRSTAPGTDTGIWPKTGRIFRGRVQRRAGITADKWHPREYHSFGILCFLQCMTPEQVMSFADACVQSSNASTRVNAVSVIGVTGSVLAKGDNTADTLKLTGNFLLGVATNDVSLVVSGGALDAIFDVFADGEESEKAAVEIKLLQALKKIQPAFKSKIRKEGREKCSTDQLCVLDNVRTNLRRFISYLETVEKKHRNRH
ncbi:unnamed protein product [Ranitomeya imitator]|uniref:SYO1-like TPR repeats domain-containing protein n=1 Tax=Ranitomeya imitator TaxID=111125 RepID=A0ABN9MS19_9NEOB|nr:unnamed protein product [Ranitomeya imitator]